MTAVALVLPNPDNGAELRRWGLAALVICAAHFGLVASYWLMPSSRLDGSPESPVVIIDFAPVPEAPASQEDIAPGPDMLAALPTAKPPPQVQPELIETTPKVEAPAEVTLPQPEPKPAEKSPEENPDTHEKVDTQQVQQVAPAPQTTAAPRSERTTAAAPRAPAPGAESRAAIASWRDLVLARLQQNKRYPAGAEARGEQGVVMLSFTVDRNGHVLARHVAKSSGVSELDAEVLAMIQRAQPLPAFPPAMGQSSVNLVVPIRFTVR